MLAGFVSMPIMTRILDKSEYGKLSLVLLTATLSGSLLQMGMPQGLTRFLPEFSRRDEVPILFSSALRTLLVSGSVFLALALLLTPLLARSPFSSWSGHVLWVAVLTVTHVLVAFFLAVYRSEHQSFQYNCWQVALRYGSVAASVAIVLLAWRSAIGVVAGKVLVELLMLATLFVVFSRRRYIKLHGASWDVSKDLVRYGLPLSFGLISSFLIESGDKFVINAMIDPDAVASYSVPYDLCTQVESAITAPMRLAIVPVIMSMWAHEDPEATAAFVSRSLRNVWRLLVPVGFGFAALSAPIVTLMASDKYTDSSAMVPLILPGLLLGGTCFLPICGFTLHKKTGRLALIVLAMGLFNILLNLILLPRYGIHGAAIATLITYVAHAVLLYSIGFYYLRFKLPLRPVAVSFVLALLMWLLVRSIGEVSGILIVDILARTLIGVIFYTAGILALDRELRTLVGQWTTRR